MALILSSLTGAGYGLRFLCSNRTPSAPSRLRRRYCGGFRGALRLYSFQHLAFKSAHADSRSASAHILAFDWQMHSCSTAHVMSALQTVQVQHILHSIPFPYIIVEKYNSGKSKVLSQIGGFCMAAEQNKKSAVVMMVISLVIVGTIGYFRRSMAMASALLTFYRGLIGGASLLVVMLLRKNRVRSSIPIRSFLLLILSGVLLGANWLLLFEAFNHTTVAIATLCYYFQPTIVLLLSPLFFRERLTTKKMICAVLAFVGMILVSGVLDRADNVSFDATGILLALGAAVFYALVVIINKKTDEIDVYRKTVIELFSAAGATVPYLLLTAGFTAASYDETTITMLLIVCVIHTGIVYLLYFGSMRGLKAQTISALSYIDPVVAMLVSGLLLHETVTALSIVGAALILGAAFMGESAFLTKVHIKKQS